MTERPVSSMRLLAGSVLAVVILVACGSASTPSAAPSAPAAAIDVDALVADAATLDGQTVRVQGYLLATDAGATMCSLLLESYPPQCGGGVVLTGEIPGDVVAGLDKTTEPDLAQAMWGWVEVVGTVDASGGAPTVSLTEIRLAAP
jgi:hypothetical protein